MRYIGIDEVGAGALAGPVMLCGFVADETFEGAGDSKSYTREQRESLYPRLISAPDTDFLLLYAEPEAIDRLGIWNAWGLVVKDVVEHLRRLHGYLPARLDGTRMPPVDGVTLVKGGDASDRVIGAASVVAKVSRDRIMHEAAKVYPGYGFDSHVGYGTSQHRHAIQSLGLCPIHRRSFCRNYVNCPMG